MHAALSITHNVGFVKEEAAELCVKIRYNFQMACLVELDHGVLIQSVGGHNTSIVLKWEALFNVLRREVVLAGLHKSYEHLVFQGVNIFVTEGEAACPTCECRQR